jgi:CrcB protein
LVWKVAWRHSHRKGVFVFSFSVGNLPFDQFGFFTSYVAPKEMTAGSVFWVFVGSGLGGVARYLLGYGFRVFWPTYFPLGTLVINFLACLFASWILSRSSNTTFFSTPLELILLVGFCGGFSTFSTFSLENANLIQQGNSGMAILYILLSIVPGILVFYFFSHSLGRI